MTGSNGVKVMSIPFYIVEGLTLEISCEGRLSHCYMLDGIRTGGWPPTLSEPEAIG